MTEDLSKKQSFASNRQMSNVIEDPYEEESMLESNMKVAVDKSEHEDLHIPNLEDNKSEGQINQEESQGNISNNNSNTSGQKNQLSKNSELKMPPEPILEETPQSDSNRRLQSDSNPENKSLKNDSTPMSNQDPKQSTYSIQSKKSVYGRQHVNESNVSQQQRDSQLLNEENEDQISQANINNANQHESSRTVNEPSNHDGIGMNEDLLEKGDYNAISEKEMSQLEEEEDGMLMNKIQTQSEREVENPDTYNYYDQDQDDNQYQEEQSGELMLHETLVNDNKASQQNASEKGNKTFTEKILPYTLFDFIFPGGRLAK